MHFLLHAESRSRRILLRPFASSSLFGAARAARAARNAKDDPSYAMSPLNLLIESTYAQSLAIFRPRETEKAGGRPAARQADTLKCFVATNIYAFLSGSEGMSNRIWRGK